MSLDCHVDRGATYKSGLSEREDHLLCCHYRSGELAEFMEGTVSLMTEKTPQMTHGIPLNSPVSLPPLADYSRISLSVGLRMLLLTWAHYKRIY